MAAVNPYRKHSEEMIEKLESAGLGFYASANETSDRIGQILMRHLVYRVQPLPTSLQPLVWDFGQLDPFVERSYIKRLVRHLSTDADELDQIVDLLGVSQQFMRERNNECSFVSIRDIERCLLVCRWFLSKKHLIFERMNQQQKQQEAILKDKDQTSTSSISSYLTDLMRAFCLSLMVCYHSCLFGIDARHQYRQLIMNKLAATIPFKNTDWLFEEIIICQTVFVDQIDMDRKNKVNFWFCFFVLNIK